MKQFLLDTNIVIYLLRSDQKFLDAMEQWGDALFFISIVTWIEILASSHHHKKNIDELITELNSFIKVPLNEKIGSIAARLIQRNLKMNRKKIFQDNAIAATALAYDIPLVTNNAKDFRGYPDLKIISP